MCGGGAAARAAPGMDSRCEIIVAAQESRATFLLGVTTPSRALPRSRYETCDSTGRAKRKSGQARKNHHDAGDAHNQEPRWAGVLFGGAACRCDARRPPGAATAAIRRQPHAGRADGAIGVEARMRSRAPRRGRAAAALAEAGGFGGRGSGLTVFSAQGEREGG
eukprot:366082-Chlamydomonas_euryale.AAC.24